MDHLEHNQVELRKHMNHMKGKMDQMLEALLAQSKNNLHHYVTENVGAISGFTIMNNPMYDLPRDYAPP